MESERDSINVYSKKHWCELALRQTKYVTGSNDRCKWLERSVGLSVCLISLHACLQTLTLPVKFWSMHAQSIIYLLFILLNWCWLFSDETSVDHPATLDLILKTLKPPRGTYLLIFSIIITIVFQCHFCLCSRLQLGERNVNYAENEILTRKNARSWSLKSMKNVVRGFIEAVR